MKKTLVSLLCIPLLGCDSTNFSYLEKTLGNLEFNSSIYTLENYSSLSSSKKSKCKKKNNKSKCALKSLNKPTVANSQRFTSMQNFTKYGGNRVLTSEKYMQNFRVKKLDSKKPSLVDKYKTPDYIISDDEAQSGNRYNNVERARSYRER